MWTSHNTSDAELSLALVLLPNYRKVKLCLLERGGTTLNVS